MCPKLSRIESNLSHNFPKISGWYRIYPNLANIETNIILKHIPSKIMGWQLASQPTFETYRMGLSENSVPLHPMVLLIIIPFLNGYFIGKINPTFSDIPISQKWMFFPPPKSLDIWDTLC